MTIGKTHPTLIEMCLIEMCFFAIAIRNPFYNPDFAKMIFYWIFSRKWARSHQRSRETSGRYRYSTQARSTICCIQSSTKGFRTIPVVIWLIWFVSRDVIFKCGSMSMTTLCYKLGGKNSFKVESPYEPGEQPKKTREQEFEFIDYLKAQEAPYMYIRHQYYIDFR